MLDKEICKRCRDASIWKWDDEADFNWDVGGRVDCPVQDSDLGDFMRFIDTLPPKRCPFFLEQFVLNQDTTPPPDEWLLDVIGKESEL